jgi:hypothetical protein
MRLILALALASFVSLASVTGCSSGSTTTSTGPFDGQWACTVTDVLTFTTPPGSTAETNTTSPTLTIVADLVGDLTVTGLTDAGSTCPLNFTSSGSTATLEAGQTCTAGLSLGYTKGTASVSGSALTASVSYTFSGAATPVEGGTAEAVAGTGVSSYVCTKPGS